MMVMMMIMMIIMMMMMDNDYDDYDDDDDDNDCSNDGHSTAYFPFCAPPTGNWFPVVKFQTKHAGGRHALKRESKKCVNFMDDLKCFSI